MTRQYNCNRKGIYVRPADRERWDQAETVAEEAGVSMSRLVADAVAQYLSGSVVGKLGVDAPVMRTRVGALR